ncbi:hypothetical protein J14TS5_34840 [Paenibacillus lautus]|uniref:GAP family protein n=1 Tax=Paenibacillus lautus TaxID=1401 RepID=UPI001B2C277C|nr:GAP family protein [Paenibacillus lautus]GIO98398.1 hypothetical protein J14TS5_34840 [Paenibacillus lautus]
MELHLFALWGIFLGLALIDTLAPGILGATAYLMLMKSEKKINRLSIFLLITQGSYFLLGIVFMLGIESVIDIFNQLKESLFVGTVLLVIGLVFIYLSFAWPKLTKNKGSNLYARIFQKIGSEWSVKAIIIAAIVVFFLEVTQALPYWGMLGLMTYNKLSLSVWLPTLAVYNMLMVLPSLLLLFWYKLYPEKTEKKLQKFKNRLMNSNAFLWVLGGAGGIFFHLGLRSILENLAQ